MISEQNALGSQSVDIRRLNNFITHAAERIPAKIVGQNEDQIRECGAACSGCRPTCDENRGEKEKSGECSDALRLVLGAHSRAPATRSRAIMRIAAMILW